MKKMFLLIASVLFLASVTYKACAMTFEDAYNNATKKPVLVYITAPWVEEYESYESVYKQAGTNLSGLYNVVKLDITTEDFKFFNDKFQLYPKLPYVLLFKKGVQISRYLQSDCIKDYACLDSKSKSFLH